MSIVERFFGDAGAFLGLGKGASHIIGQILATWRSLYLSIWTVFDPDTKKATKDPNLVCDVFGNVFPTFSGILGRFGFWPMVQIPL